MAQRSVNSEGGHDTVEFDSLTLPLNGDALKDTVDEKLVIELLGQLLLTASQAHRTLLEEQENRVRSLMQRIADDPQSVEAELLKVYQDIKASFSRLVQAIGDHPLG